MRGQRKFRAPGRVLPLWDRLRESISDIVAPLSNRERLVYSLVVLGFVFILFAAPSRAYTEDEGKLFQIAARECSADQAWASANLASGQPTIGPNDDRIDINPSNSAQWLLSAGSVVCGNFETNPEHTISKPALNISLNSFLQDTSEASSVEPSLDLSSSNYQPTQLDSRPVVVEPNALDDEATNTLDYLFDVLISTDGGDSWELIHRLDSSILNLTVPQISIAIPEEVLVDTEQFAVQIEAVTAQEDLAFLLDSIAVSYEVSRADEVELKLSKKPSLGGELPVISQGNIKFDLTAKDPAEGLWQGLGSKIKKTVATNNGPSVSASAKVIDSNGVIVESGDLKLDWQDNSLSNQNNWQATLDASDNQLEPGRYTLQVTYTSDDGRTQSLSQDFLWGVLAINTNKTVYKTADNGNIFMTVLDETGATVCDGALELTIDGPSTSTTLSTAAGQLLPSETCLEYGDHIEPDYQADYQFAETGEYLISLIATTDNGSYSTTTTVTAEEAPEFSVERLGPTRIFPVVDYPMRLVVSSETDFEGTIREFVPKSFTISDSTIATTYDQITNEGDLQVINWTVSLVAGESQILGYTFDAPDISPEFYLLGQAQVLDDFGSISFEETRQWQLAGDAVGQMILFYDGATIPTGWTCVSCSSGDDFYQRFVRGAATYGTTSGGTTHTHTANGSVAATGSAAVGWAQSGTVAINNHTHTYSPTLNSPSNLPSYRQLKLIRYDTTGEPTTLPTGVIGVFDAAVPSGWTRYSAQDGSFVRGEGSAGTTGGSNTHTVTISGTTGASAGGTNTVKSGGTQVGVATSTHDHTVSGTSAPANNEPSYIEVILGKLDSAAAPPNDLIAMWDDEAAGGWDVISGSSQALNNKFIKPASTYGTSGGTDTHSHTNTVLTSGAPNQTASSRSSSSAASDAHTHQVTVSSYSNENHLPPYREAVFAKRNAVTNYEQSAYRFYDNDNSTDVDTALAAQDTAATAPAQGTPFRLRMLVHVSVVNLSSSGQNFKLQYASRSGTCDTSFTGETYVDVATASGDIRYSDNSSPADGAALTTNAADPTHSSDTIRAQTYEEANNFTNSQTAINTGEDGLWDFSLVDFSAPGTTAYCFRIVESDGSQLDSYSVIPQITTAVPPPRMVLMFDGATIPSGWTCVSCNSGDEAYQRFIRGEATSSTGGNATHNHTGTGSAAAGSANDGRNNDGSGIAEDDHAHSYTPTIENANNLPAYRQLKLIKFNTGTPATIPSGAITLFDAAVPAGWTRYSAQDGNYVRGEGTAGTTGGSNNHTHPISGTTGGSTGAEDSFDGSGSQEDVATAGHTHTVSGTSTSVDLQPPFIETILGKANSDTTVPGSMIAMWDKDPGGTWTCLSCTGSDPFHQTFFKPAATYGTTGGNTTHSHANSVITSSSPSATTATRSGNALAADTHTHQVTVSAISTDNHIPEYIDYVFAKSPSTNTAPNSPTNLAQEKTDTTSLAVGDWTNETTVVFKADATDTDNPDSLALCVEVETLATSFDNVNTACGSTVSYTGSAVSVSVTIPSLVDGSEYHWQARVKDGVGALSSWVSFGANPESARDFAVDSSSPTGTVYDGSTTDVDIDYNNGDLDELSANWDIDSSASGLSGYEYSIGTAPGLTDVKSWTSTGTTDSATATSLSLNTSQPYYFNVRTTDNAGSVSIISSDGQFIAPTLSFSTSTSEINFGNLNAGNGYTGTQVSTTTTSTNAYNGYEIRAYASGLLENGQGDTIAMFDGGTWALPDEWLGGDLGYGLTSSDTLVAGTNRFNNSPCPGGGSPPCYAPVSTVAPGDIIADHVSTVSGTPIINEQFNITHRVTTTATQDPGTYTTVLIYSITAIY